MEERMQIGFIGLGIMGRPMALNLMKAGFSLTVYNRTASKCEPLRSAGASVASSPRQVAASADVIITMVSDTPDVESVLFSSEGVWHGLKQNQVVIDMSTISPQATVEFARRLAEKDCDMLDAPVSGGEKGAIEGTLTIMVGGKREVFDRCLPIFQAMGNKVIHVGESGNGQKTKLVNQLICACNIVSMVEGLRFASLSGLDLETTLKVVSSGAAASWMLANLAPKILQGDFAPGFLIRLQQKDLRLVRESIQKIDGQRGFPATELAYRLFTEAVEKGLGEQGTQALIKLYKQ
jgi:3-hydroxyisobutyrate dehydrogenase-like beta-hydroxyacid dehydrogenase